MPGDMKHLGLFARTGLIAFGALGAFSAFGAIGGFAARRAYAQGADGTGSVIRARALGATAPVKMFVPSGTLRLIGWNRDSIVVRGRLATNSTLSLTGTDTAGMKLIVEARRGDSPGFSDLIVYLPRRSQVSLKSVDARISGQDVYGWFYTVSGTIHLGGSASSVDAESMSGNIELDVATPWARVKTGQGHLQIGGSPQDVDASTIGGALEIDAPAILRGRFSSVTGDIRYASTMAPGSLFEFSDHSGGVDLVLPRDASGRFDLSSVTGDITNAFVQVRPVAHGTHTVRLTLGAGDAQVTVRTFKGAIRLLAR